MRRPVFFRANPTAVPCDDTSISVRPCTRGSTSQNDFPLENDQSDFHLIAISAVYTTEDVRTKIASSPAAVGLDVPVYTAGPIVDVDAHAESAVKFLTTNGVGVADLLVAQDADVARRFGQVAAVNGLCLNDTVLAPDFE